MTARRIEVGLVSTSAALADFYAHVFELEALPAIDAGPGTVHPLQVGDAVLKVMVPHAAPVDPPATGSFLAMRGIRYLTIGTDDLDGVVARALALGGRVQHGPMELGPDVRLAVLEDPDGNAIEVVQAPT